MELIAVIFMLVGGGALAVSVMVLVALARREEAPSGGVAASVSHRDAVAASLLYSVVIAGGAGQSAALRDVRRTTGIAAPVSVGIDLGGWAARYARLADGPACEALLDHAVRLAAAAGQPIPTVQYVALLDLCFGMGFHADALARLRERYQFDYIDPARQGRPKHAGRQERVTLFQRDPQAEAECAAALEIQGAITRQSIIAAYRKLAAQTHPDRYHDADPAARDEAALRFIELTRAYESLLAMYGD